MEVVECLQVWENDGEDFKFDHYSVVLKMRDEFFKAQSENALALGQNIDISELRRPPLHIPPEDMWPRLEDSLTIAPFPIPHGTFQKRPSLISYTARANQVKPRDLLLHEAQICEILRKHPHDNIASYLGCICNGNSISGLLLIKYEETLSERLRDLSRPLDASMCLKGIKAGLDHLHSLGLNHNDINPRNIMLDKKDMPVIIDFDSCEREGGLTLRGGTPDWTDGEFITRSEQRNDEFGLLKLRDLLKARD